jgi:hypothetical protein
LKSGKIKKLKHDPFYGSLIFEQIEKLENGKIVASCRDDLLLEIQLSADGFTCQPYGDLKGHAASTSFFKSDKAGNLYVNSGDASVLVLVPSSGQYLHQFSYELPRKGGVTSLLESKSKPGVFLTNDLCSIRR